MTVTYILLGILGLLSVLLLLLLSFSNTSDDPGYGTEHSGTYMVGGLLFLLIIVDLIFLAFSDFKSFLICLAILIVVGFVFNQIDRSRARAKWNSQDEVQQVEIARSEYDSALSELKARLEEGPTSLDMYLDFLEREGCGNLLQYLPDDLRANEELVRAAIEQPELALQITESNDPVVVPRDSPLRYASDELRQNRSLVLKAISFCAGAYEYASDELKADPEVYLTALHTDLTHSYDDSSRDIRWNPCFDSSFYKDSWHLYEFLGQLWTSLDYQLDTGMSWDDDYWDENRAEHIKEHYSEYFPSMFSDWRVICEVLTDEWWWGKKWLSVSEYFPAALFANAKTTGGVEQKTITHRDFFVFAINEGYPAVIDYVSDELKHDEEIQARLTYFLVDLLKALRDRKV